MRTAKEITRYKDNKFCTIEITLEDGNLSICGTAGVIVSETEAKAKL